LCDCCEYITSNKKDYVKHLSTAKHQNETNETKMKQKIPKKSPDHICCCGALFNSRTTLWRHKRACIMDEKNDTINAANSCDSNEKDGLIQLLIKENQEFKNLILEVCKNFQGNNITNSNINSNINSNNKTFNLQIFLNETCKDAMNINEFIESMDIQLSDFENVGKLGFVDGISNIIIKNLKALDVEKRPIHCSDTKRETMYIKDDDKWEKEDDDRKRLKRVIKGVQDRNIRMIPKWKELYPDCILSNSKHTDKFNNMCFEIMGGNCGTNNNFSQKNEKIIKKIAKEVAIIKDGLYEKLE
jgi:uncharacterized C2H2 Zn-finger protein